MKKLNKLQNLIYYIGGILLVIGAILPMFGTYRIFAPHIYTLGAVMFSTIQFMCGYEGRDLTVRRLRRQQIMGATLLLLAGVMMFMSLYQNGPFQADEWKLALVIGSVFEVYTALRLPSAYEKSLRQEQQPPKKPV